MPFAGLAAWETVIAPHDSDLDEHGARSQSRESEDASRVQAAEFA